MGRLQPLFDHVEQALPEPLKRRGIPPAQRSIDVETDHDPAKAGKNGLSAFELLSAATLDRLVEADGAVHNGGPLQNSARPCPPRR